MSYVYGEVCGLCGGGNRCTDGCGNCLDCEGCGCCGGYYEELTTLPAEAHWAFLWAQLVAELVMPRKRRAGSTWKRFLPFHVKRRV